MMTTPPLEIAGKRNIRFIVGGGLLILNQYRFSMLAGLLISTFIMTGCGTVTEVKSSGQSEQLVTKSQDLQRTDAERILLSLPEIQQLETMVRDKGNKLVFKTQEAPSHFVITVGEDRGYRVVWTRWYLVGKADGSVTYRDTSQGPVPRD